MNDATPEIEQILTELTQMCREALLDSVPLDYDRVEQLAGALSNNGWKRHNAYNAPLSVQLTSRVVDSLDRQPVHHKAELEGIANQIQQAYDRVAKFNTSMPESDQPVSRRKSLASKPPRTL